MQLQRLAPGLMRAGSRSAAAVDDALSRSVVSAAAGVRRAGPSPTTGGAAHRRRQRARTVAPQWQPEKEENDWDDDQPSTSSAATAPPRLSAQGQRLRVQRQRQLQQPPAGQRLPPAARRPPGPQRSVPRDFLSQHVAAATAAYAPPPPPAAPAAGGGDAAASGPTAVPRQRGVTDGAWDAADEAAVADALRDAKRVVDRKFKDHGEVLLGKSAEELRDVAMQAGAPAYRGQQLLDGLLRGARSLDAVHNVPKDLKAALAARGVRTGRSIVHHSVTAADGTRKFLLQLYDGRVVETVGIPVDDANRRRLTVCVSSQVGCPMRCTFCATGKGGFARNLAPHEIVDQVLTVQEEFGERVSNVVFMGMGEPLLNLPSVVAAHGVLTGQLGIGARHITISTVGVPNAIDKLAQFQMQSTLAVSIHAPTQQLRETIVPSARSYPLDTLMRDCSRYFQSTGRRVTFEYTLMAGVNDGKHHAQQLAALLKSHDLRGHVNLIPWNPVDQSDFQRPSKRGVLAFQKVLETAGIPASLRVTRGLEAAAACGQLRNQFQKEPLQQFSVPA